MNSGPDLREDAINVTYYLGIIIKRKITIILVFLIFVLGGLVYSFTRPVLYKSETILKIGLVDGPLMSEEAAVRVIHNRDFLNEIAKIINQGLSSATLVNAIKTEQINNANLLSVSVICKDPELAKIILEKVGGKFIEIGNELYKRKVDIIRDRVKNLEYRQRLIGEEIKKIQSDMSVSKSSDFPLIQNTISNYEHIYSDILDKVYPLKKQLADSAKFDFFEYPAAPKNPIKIHKKRNTVLAGILGLMFGVLLALFKEYLHNNLKVIEEEGDKRR